MNLKMAELVLKEFTGCLEEKYFLCYGTSLGANREKEIIAHDLDIDIGIMRDDFKLSYVNDIISQGFDLIRLYGTLECGLELSFRKKGIKIDLMVFYQEGDIIWNSLWDNGGKNGMSDMIIHSYPSKIFEIENIRFCGGYFYSLGIEYIKEVYGKDWETPVTIWDWRTDHMCRDENLKYKILQKYGR